jgi:hypothetical protein
MNLVGYRDITPGYARNHRFEIAFFGPAINQLNFTGQEDARLFTSLAFSTTLPIVTFEPNPVQVQYGLPKINMVGSANYSPWTVTFYCDEARIIRNRFLLWQNQANSFVSGTREYQNPNNYKANAIVSLLSNDNDVVDRDGNQQTMYFMVGMFPTEVGTITLQQQDSGISTFDVQFVYDYFVINPQGVSEDIKKFVDENGSFNFKKDVGLLKDITKYTNKFVNNGKPLIPGQLGGIVAKQENILNSILGKTRTILGTIGGAGGIIKRGK